MYKKSNVMVPTRFFVKNVFYKKNVVLKRIGKT